MKIHPRIIWYNKTRTFNWDREYSLALHSIFISKSFNYNKFWSNSWSKDYGISGGWSSRIAESDFR